AHEGIPPFVVADIPGLVEGASEGVGLGLRFLRHVERTRLLLHLVTLSPDPGRDPLHDYEVVRKELVTYKPELAERPEILVLSQADLPEVLAAYPELKQAFAERWRRLFAGAGLTALAALIGVVVLRTQERGSLLPPASIFHRLTGKDLRLGEFGCDKVAELSFRCGPHRVLADMISGVWGMHLCMHGPDVGELRVNLETELGSFLQGRYEPAKEGPGSIEV